jgi:catechol-2,3-dioxygenase
MGKTPRQLGHLVIKVRDLKRSEEFYKDWLGLSETGRIGEKMVFLSAHADSSHELAMIALGEDTPGPEKNRVGLAHMAWQLESMEDLRSLHGRLKKEKRQFSIGDHGISLGVYFHDPDGNQIECFYELTRDKWPQGANVTGGAKFPLPLEEEAAVAGDA